MVCFDERQACAEIAESEEIEERGVIIEKRRKQKSKEGVKNCSPQKEGAIDVTILEYLNNTDAQGVLLIFISYMSIRAALFELFLRSKQSDSKVDLLGRHSELHLRMKGVATELLP